MSLVQEAWNETYKSIQVINPNAGIKNRDNIFEQLYYGYVGSKANTDEVYHNFDHIIHCLNQLRFLNNMGMIKYPLAMELALWFHDVFYDIRCTCNEEMSANIADECLSGILPTDTVVRVRELIRCTAYSGCLTTPYIPQYERTDNDQDHLYIRDIDFSAFGSILPQTLDAGLRIRLESPYLDDEEFYKRRLNFLLMLAQEHFKLFHTMIMNSMYEDIAKSNIQREIDHVKSMIDNLTSS